MISQFFKIMKGDTDLSPRKDVPMFYLGMIMTFAVAAVFSAISFLNKDHSSTTPSAILVSGWQHLGSDETLVVDGDPIRRTELFQDFNLIGFEKPSLYLDDVSDGVEVYQDGVLVYSDGSPQDDFGYGPGSKVLLIPLQQTTTSPTRISIKLFSRSSVLGLQGFQAIGDVDDLRTLCVREHFGQLAVSIIFFFGFAAFLGVAVWNPRSTVYTGIYAVYCLAGGVYFLLQSRFMNIFLEQPIVTLIMNRYALAGYTLSGLLLFELAIRAKSTKIGMTLAFGVSLMMVFTLWGAHSYTQQLDKLHLPWLIAASVCQGYLIIASYQQLKETVSYHKKIIVFGVAVSASCGLLDHLGVLGVFNILNHQYLSHWGGLMMLCALGWALVSEAKKSQEALDEFTNSLQEKIASRTKELQESLTSLRAEMGARERAEKLAQNSARQAAVSELSRGLAHEINNPLTILNGYAHVIKSTIESNLDYPKSELLLRSTRELIRMSDRINKVVRGLLEFAEGREDGQCEDVVLYELTESLSTIVAPLLRSNNASLEIHFQDESIRSLPVFCRPIQLKQVLVNLISNGIDAYLPGDKRVVELIVEQNNDATVFSVVDHGRGIPEELRAKIFDPFISTKLDTKGTGLGLSVSHGLAKSNGWELTFVSKRSNDPHQRGTKFMLIVPHHQSLSRSA